MLFTFKAAANFSGGGFGKSLMDLPQWFIDAMTVLQCAEASAQQELNEPVNNGDF